MASGVYNNQKRQLGSNNWSGDTDIKLLLVGATFSFDPDHEFVSQIAGELSGSGYSRKVLSGKIINYDTTNNEARYIADPVIYPGANFGTIRGGVVFKDTGVSTTSRLIAYVELDSPIPTNSGQITFMFNAEGVFKHR